LKLAIPREARRFLKSKILKRWKFLREGCAIFLQHFYLVEKKREKTFLSFRVGFNFLFFMIFFKTKKECVFLISAQVFFYAE